MYPLEVQSQEHVSEEYKEKESPETADEPGDIPDDTRAPTPDDDPADRLTELATSDAPRRSQRVAAQRADANRMAGTLELEDD